MRILLLISDLGTGGAERVASVLTSQWASEGHEVTLMATYSKGGTVQVPLDGRVRFLSILDLPGRHVPMRRSWLARLRALSAFAGREKFDVICSFLVNVNVMAVLAGRWAGIPVIVSERTFPPMHDIGAILKTLRRVTYPLAHSVVMQTDEGLEWLSAAIPAAKAEVIGNPVEHPPRAIEPYRDPRPLCPDGRKVLLAVGRLSEEKRFGLLIDAFAEVSAQFSEWDMVIVGEGPLASDLTDRARSQGLHNRVKLPGRVGNIGDWYERADAFALTSSFEGFPNVLLEALSAGVPALAIDIPTGPAQVLRDGGNGVLLPRASEAREIAAGLRRLFAGPWPETESIALQLRQQYSPSAIAARWMALFRAAREDRRAA